MFQTKFPRKQNNDNKGKSKLVAKQWSFKALGIFDKNNCMKKYFLVNSALYLLEPYKIISNSNSSFKFLKEGSFLKQVIKEFLSIYCKKRAMQEEWPAGFVSEPVMHSAQTIFKMMTKFMFIQMTNFNRNLGDNLTPAGSIYFKLKKSF